MLNKSHTYILQSTKTAKQKYATTHANPNGAFFRHYHQHNCGRAAILILLFAADRYWLLITYLAELKE